MAHGTTTSSAWVGQARLMALTPCITSCVLDPGHEGECLEVVTHDNKPLRLDELTPAQRRLVLALIEADKSTKQAT